MNRALRAVLFDLGNTLVDYYHAADFAPILKTSVGAMCDFVEQRKALVVDRAETIERALRLNVEDPSGRVRRLESRLSELFPRHSLTDADLRALSEIFLQPIFRMGSLDADALPMLAGLRQQGIRTAIVSNTPWGSSREQWLGELRRHRLVEAVDVSVFCVDAGWRKPAPQIFRHALSLMRVDAHEAAFVGDDPRWDVAGAEGSGLRPILLNPQGVNSSTSCLEIRGLQELLPLLETIGAI